MSQYCGVKENGVIFNHSAAARIVVSFFDKTVHLCNIIVERLSTIMKRTAIAVIFAAFIIAVSVTAAFELSGQSG